MILVLGLLLHVREWYVYYFELLSYNYMVLSGGRQPRPRQCYPPYTHPALPPSATNGADQPSTTIRQDLICYTSMLALATYALHKYYLYTIYIIPLEHPTHPTGGAEVK